MITKEVKTYDFNKPEKISKDQLRNLQILHENFSRVATVEWSAMLRTVVQVRLESVSQTPFGEVMAGWSVPSCIGIWDIPPLEGQMVVCVSPEFMFSLIDRLLGGQGRGAPKIRDFTELELVLIRRLFKVVSGAIKEVWHSLVNLEPNLAEIESNPQFVQSFSPNEPVLFCDYSAVIGDVTGKISLVVSFISLEELLPKLSAQHMLRARAKGEERLGEERVRDVDVPLVVTFPPIQLSLSQVRRLKPGDVIDVRTPVSDKVHVQVNDRLLFKGILGRVEKKRAVKLVSVVTY